MDKVPPPKKIDDVGSANHSIVNVMHSLISVYCTQKKVRYKYLIKHAKYTIHTQVTYRTLRSATLTM